MGRGDEAGENILHCRRCYVVSGLYVRSWCVSFTCIIPLYICIVSVAETVKICCPARSFSTSHISIVKQPQQAVDRNTDKVGGTMIQPERCRLLLFFFSLDARRNKRARLSYPVSFFPHRHPSARGARQKQENRVHSSQEDVFLVQPPRCPRNTSTKLPPQLPAFPSLPLPVMSTSRFFLFSHARKPGIWGFISNFFFLYLGGF